MTSSLIRGAKEAPKTASSIMDTIIITQELRNSWLNPPFQRQLRKNKKVLEIAEKLRADGGVVSGVITLGVVNGQKAVYLLDGQHRVEAAMLSGVECYADIRVRKFDTLAEMGDEFATISSQIVRTTPDDLLRAREGVIPAVALIKRQCPFVGYDQIRRGDHAPILSMSTVIRCWTMSARDAPGPVGCSVMEMAQETTMQEAEQLCQFLNAAQAAWGNDEEYQRLWAGLNLTMTMWLWRRLVINVARGKKRAVVLNADQFKKCLMAMSAKSVYVDWLTGRRMSEKDRGPTLKRIKEIFVKRLHERDIGLKNTKLPAPEWSSR